MFVRSPSSISNIVIPFPLRRRLCFYLFFSSKILSVRRVTTCPPRLFFFFLFFASPRLSIHSLLPARRPHPLVVPYPYRIVPYYITIRIPLLRLTDRLTNLI